MKSETTDPAFDALLAYLKRTRGFEFTAYKPVSLMRRLQRRMRLVGVDAFADYQDYLEVHPEEFAQLFNALLINVTAFFRDEPSWAYLRDELLPKIVAGEGAIRAWSAGCASGEEAYSITMLLAELLGRERLRERVKVYATDLDEHALNQARSASYTQKQVGAVPPALLEKYFAREGDRYVFDKELRRSVIFGRHDLILDAPISRANVLICRNTLMYFNTEAQGRILARLHFALADDGVLFLGKAEMLLTHPRALHADRPAAPAVQEGCEGELARPVRDDGSGRRRGRRSVGGGSNSDFEERIRSEPARAAGDRRGGAADPLQ